MLQVPSSQLFLVYEPGPKMGQRSVWFTFEILLNIDHTSNQYSYKMIGRYLKSSIHLGILSVKPGHVVNVEDAAG